MLRKLLLLILCVVPLSAATAAPVLMDFYADWCGPCQAMTPIVNQLSEEGYTVQRINVDQDRQTADQYGIESIPAFVIVNEGREVDRIVGETSAVQLRAVLSRATHTQVSMERPKPAWRYEHQTGHYRAVVRIVCELGGRDRALGSGVIVKWAGKRVILTAQHVIRGAKKITVFVLSGGKWVPYRARAVSVSETKDCCALMLDGTLPEDVVSVECATKNWRRAKGDRLTSCGFGPDGKLACNTGLFIRYNQTSSKPDGTADWMEFSGHARGGDSGGPIFDEDNNLAGILWGTDGSSVQGVQIGYVIRVLRGIRDTQERSIVEPQRFVEMQFPGGSCGGGSCGLFGRPSQSQHGQPVPGGTPTPVDIGDLPSPTPQLSASEVASSVNQQYLMPFRNEISRQQEDIKASLRANQEQINQILDALNRQQQQPGQVQPPVEVTPVEPVKPDGGPRTTIGRAADKQAGWLAEHGGLISGWIAGIADDKLASDKMSDRTIGTVLSAVAAIVYLAGWVLLFIFGIVLIVYIHKFVTNHGLLVKAQAAAAATPTQIDDVLVKGWSRLSGLNDKLEARVDSVTGKVKEKLAPKDPEPPTTPAT